MAGLPLNLATPTLGGKQFWSDAYLFGGWRIQQNVFSKHFRLLDRWDIRRAWGDFEQCQSALAAAQERGDAKLRSKKVCVLLHGYLRSKDSFGSISLALENAGFEVYGVNYASTQYPLEQLCEDLDVLLGRIALDFEQLNVITHSMGGIIARGLLSKKPLKGDGRLVMIAPPNAGARLADYLLASWPSQYIAGPAGRQLASDAAAFARNAGTPQCPFLVIAGARGDGAGYNPAIPGDDDGLLGVEETRLDGATAHEVVPAMHTFIMNHRDTVRHTLSFLGVTVQQ